MFDKALRHEIAEDISMVLVTCACHFCHLHNCFTFAAHLLVMPAACHPMSSSTTPSLSVVSVIESLPSFCKESGLLTVNGLPAAFKPMFEASPARVVYLIVIESEPSFCKESGLLTYHGAVPNACGCQ